MKNTNWLRAAVCLAWIVNTHCSSSSEYQCPAPIGSIIRDDCEAYRIKFESLQVELGASVGNLGAQAKISQETLRSPSELMQILMMRTMSMCKDFNACRMPPLDYRERREHLEQIFTSLTVINEQLKSDIPAASKVELIQKMNKLLGEMPATATATPSPTKTPALPKRAKNHHYRSHLPWFGTAFLPPQPKSPAGFPQIADLDFNLAHVFRQVSPYGVIGYRPSVRVYLRGPVEADDQITVEWPGVTSSCPLSLGETNGLTSANCLAPDKLVLTGTQFAVHLSYRRAEDGKVAALGSRHVKVLAVAEEDSTNGSHRYGINYDAQLAQAELIFRPYQDQLPPDFEQPSLSVVLKIRKYQPATARCWVDGKLITSALTPSPHSGQLDTFQDRPRYQKVSQNSSRAVAQPFIIWQRYDFGLPFLASAEANPSLPAEFARWPQKGSWRCLVAIEGEPVREINFLLNADGKPSFFGGAPTSASASWPLPTKIIDNPFEKETR